MGKRNAMAALAVGIAMMTTTTMPVFAATSSVQGKLDKNLKNAQKWAENQTQKLLGRRTMPVGHLEADFASGLGLSLKNATEYFPPKLKTTSTATVSELEMATAKFYGITSWAWEPGQSVWGWSHAIDLLNGVQGSKNLYTSEGGAIERNLSRMNAGYWWDGHEYHLQYRPFNVVTAWAKDPDVNAKLISSIMPAAIHEIDAITFSRNLATNITTFTSPTLSKNDVNSVAIGSAYNNPATDGGHSSYTAFSFDRVTWTPATSNNPKSTIIDPLGYNSEDPANGGMDNPPKTVYVRCYGNAQITMGYYVPHKMILDPLDVKIMVRGNKITLTFYAY